MVNYVLIRDKVMKSLRVQKIDEKIAFAIADAIREALIEYEMQTSGKKLH